MASTIVTRSRRRNRDATDVDNDPFLWRDFQQQQHSLSINASEVAVCAGCHEYKSVPGLLMAHVYQGRGGQALLRHDARLLGLQLVSEEEQLLEIAVVAGAATTLALTQALQVKHGETKIESIETAQKMRQDVVQTAKASKKLTPQQLKTLEEQTRYSIDTGCGHTWEDEALTQYERQCGWDVRRRNEECRIWHFERLDDSRKDGNNMEAENAMDTGEDKGSSKSLCPVGPAVPMQRRQRRPSSSGEATDNSNATTVEGQKGSPIDLTNDNSIMDDAAVGTEDDDVEPTSSDTAQGFLEPSASSSPDDESKPVYFLSIKGMIDGIRDELIREPKGENHRTLDDREDNDDEDSWALRTVVVECKHRMRSILAYPRFYECIQAVVYCQMYDAEEADIIQVLRKSKPVSATKMQSKAIEVDNFSTSSNTHIQEESGPMKAESAPSPKKTMLTDYFRRLPSETMESDKAEAVVDDDMKENIEETVDVGQQVPSPSEEHKKTGDSAAKIKQTTAKQQSAVDMEIAVNRISLNDQFNHLQNWNTIVLPRLREWADGVYRIRQCDELRYRLLSSMATAQSTDNLVERQHHLQLSWDLAFEQCPFLRNGLSYHCYQREVSSTVS